jgi:hypothetical protein
MDCFLVPYYFCDAEDRLYPSEGTRRLNKYRTRNYLGRIVYRMFDYTTRTRYH